MCEDSVVETDGFVAVIDGATSKSSVRYDGLKGGKKAMLLARECIMRMPCWFSMEECVCMLTENVRRFYQECGMMELVKMDASARLTCSIVLYSKRRHELWMIGDCQFRYEGKTYKNEKIGDALLAGIRADILKYLIRNGYKPEDLQQNDLGRSWILDALCDQCNFQNLPIEANNPYSFVVLDGFPVDIRRVPVYKLPNNDSNHLILASDGYPILCDTFVETESALREILEKDPLCIDLNVSTKGLMVGNKSFDDRTYVMLSDS